MFARSTRFRGFSGQIKGRTLNLLQSYQADAIWLYHEIHILQHPECLGEIKMQSLKEDSVKNMGNSTGSFQTKKDLFK